MSERQQWPKRYSEALFSFKNIQDPFALRDDVLSWLLEAIEPRQRAVYEYVIGKGLEWVDSADVAVHFKVKTNDAATLLKSLYDLHLLERNQVIDQNGKRYEYTGR